jgi:hypothetical protein
MTTGGDDQIDLDDMMAALANIPVDGGTESDPMDLRHGTPLPLNPEALLEDLRNCKRAQELAHKWSAKKSKKVEKSKGYLDKLAARDKQREHAAHPQKPKKK